MEWTRGRLVVAGSVDISRPIAPMRAIRRCIIDVGFKAIRVPPWLWLVPPTARLFYPVYAACCELGVPFCTQIGQTGPLMPSEVGRSIFLDQSVLDFLDLLVVWERLVIRGQLGYCGRDTASRCIHRYLSLHA